MQLIACPGCDAARAAAKRCIADPGPPRTGTVPGLQRTTRLRLALRCARDTKGDQRSLSCPKCWPPRILAKRTQLQILAKRTQLHRGGRPRESVRSAGTTIVLDHARDQPAAVRNEPWPIFPVSSLFFTGNRATSTCHDAATHTASSHDVIELMEDRGEVEGVLGDPAAVG